MFHFGSYPFGKFQLVRRLLGADGQINGIQAVDTVITLWSLFLTGNF